MKAVIFDMDGVLLDTERVSRRAWDIVGERWECPIEEAFLSKLRGGNLEQIKQAFLQRFGEDFAFDSMWQEKRQLFLRMLDEEGVPVKKGAFELISYLKEEKYKIALATGSGRKQAIWNLENVGLDNSFDTIICGDEVTRSKPDPEIFLKAAEGLGVSPWQCLVIEDSLNGIQAALAGGFHVIMVPDLTMPDQSVKQKVDGVLEDLTEVIEFLDKKRK